MIEPIKIAKEKVEEFKKVGSKARLDRIEQCKKNTRKQSEKMKPLFLITERNVRTRKRTCSVEDHYRKVNSEN